MSPPSMSYALSFDINLVTVVQVSRSHLPAFDLAVRYTRYICRMWLKVEQCYLWYLANGKLVGGNL